MASSLTDRQTKDLNQAILEYLLSNPDKYAKTIESMKEECQMENVTNSGKAILEKKWVSVIRLQKKVMELEAKLANSSEKPFNNGNSSNSSKSKNFPRGPPKANMQGHREPITCVGIHPTYSICASGSEDASIRIWDYDSGSFERTLKGHIGPVTGVCFEPTTGKILASCSTDMTAKLWDTNNNYVCINTLRGHDHSISDVKFNLPISDTILTCSRDQTIRYWDTSSGYCQKTLANGHSEWIRCISVSLDGAWVASGSSDHTIAIWNNVNGQLVHKLVGHEHVVEAVSFGKKPLLMQLNDNKDTSNANSSGDSSVPPPPPGTNPDCFHYLVSGSRDRTIRLWDTSKNQCLGSYHIHENWVRGVCFHPNNKYIFSCSDDRSIKVLDIKEGRCCHTINDAHAHFITSMAIPSSNSSFHNKCLITGSVDKSLSIWDCV